MLFKEVIGHDEIKARLRASVQSDRISHAHLFSGDLGYGGLALALAFVQYLFCTGPKGEEACGECPSCRKMAKGIHPDLHFSFPVVKLNSTHKPVSDDFIHPWRARIIDNPYFQLSDWGGDLGGSENAQPIIYVYESQHIIRKLSLKSFESDYKALIIWLPEKMNSESANRILKILEEPYAGTVFILVAERPDELLTTILSRTQHLPVPPIAGEAIDRALQAQGLEAAQAGEIAHIARGSWIKARKRIQESEQAIYNQEKFMQLMRLCWERKMLPVNQFVNEVSALGRENQKLLLGHFLRMIRENFIRNLGRPEMVFMNRREEEFSVRFSPYVNENNVVPLYEGFEKAYADISRNGNGKIIFTDLCIKVMQNIRPNT